MTYFRTIQTFLTALLLIISFTASAAINVNIQNAIKKGNYEKALSLTEEALKKDKKNKELLLTKGFTLVKLQKFDEAIRYYKSLKRKLKTEAEPSNNLAMIYRMQNNYDLAIKEFEATIKKFPRYPLAYRNLGDTYLMLARAEYQRGFKATGSVPLKNKLIALTPRPHKLAARQARATAKVKNTTTPAAEKRLKQTKIPSNKAPKNEAILNILRSWVDDWASRDINKYLSHYASNFKPENGLNLKTWTQSRKDIFQRPDKITLNLSDVVLTLQKNNIITAQFIQHYQTKTLNLTTDKTLTLQKSGNNSWLIIRELSIDR